MKTLQIRRTATSEKGTPGLIQTENFPLCVCLEPEWLNNRPASPGVQGSCIPAGTYICKRVKSHTYGIVFEITDVPGRTYVYYHWGNEEDNSDGCVLLGDRFGQLGPKKAILDSKIAFKKFMGYLRDDDEFRVIIVDDFLTNLN